MKSYSLIEVWAKSRFSPRKADTVIPWHFLHSTTEHSWYLQLKVHFCWHLMYYVMVVLQTYFSFCHWQFNLYVQIWERKKVAHSIDRRAQAVTRVFGYLSTHAYSLHIEDARIFPKSRNKFVHSHFPWNIILSLSFTIALLIKARAQINISLLQEK